MDAANAGARLDIDALADGAEELLLSILICLAQRYSKVRRFPRPLQRIRDV